MSWPQSWTPMTEDYAFDLRSACKNMKGSGGWVWEWDVEMQEPTLFLENLAYVYPLLSRNEKAVKAFRAWTFRGVIENIEFTFHADQLRSPEYLLPKGSTNEDKEFLLARAEPFTETAPYWRAEQSENRIYTNIHLQDPKLLRRLLNRNSDKGVFSIPTVTKRRFYAPLSADVVRSPIMLVLTK